MLEDGGVIAWGSNVEGQLGNGPMGRDGELGIHQKPSITPVRVTGLSNMADVEAGREHAIALPRDGTVWGWGTRDEGMLGDGAPKGLRPVPAVGPVAVRGLADITQIATGPKHNLALRRDGRVFSWGENGSGELGVGTRASGWTPAEVTGLDHVVAIAAGTDMNHGISGAVREDGTVWMWGSNASGMMGNGTGPLSPDDAGGRVLAPVPVKGVANAKQISIGFGHVAVLLGDGTLRMWGHDGWGQLGVNTSGGYHTAPVKPIITNVAAVYLGGPHSFAVRTDGTFWLWGPRVYDGSTGVLAKYLHVPTRYDLP